VLLVMILGLFQSNQVAAIGSIAAVLGGIVSLGSLCSGMRPLSSLCSIVLDFILGSGFQSQN